jgi:TDG/mug DNA glycosylase family protein
MQGGAAARAIVAGRDAMHVHSFPAISDPTCRVLILGSMPGKASLRAKQYYAHLQNAFWRILSEYFDVDVEAPYEQRVAGLIQHRLAVWDVLRSCTRESSLDSDIVEASIVPNDFAGFFSKHPELHTVCFNGAKAEACFRRYVLPSLPEPNLACHRLPSTSPANASIPYAKKLAAWKIVSEAA